jgi:hypothetical protein
MVGPGSAFAAWLAANLLAKGLDAWSKEESTREEQVKMLSAAVRVGLAAARRLYQTGFGPALPPAYPGCDCFAKLEGDAERFAVATVPVFADASDPDPQGGPCWMPRSRLAASWRACPKRFFDRTR